LNDQDPDPGGKKTFGFVGSGSRFGTGSATLVKTIHITQLNFGLRPKNVSKFRSANADADPKQNFRIRFMIHVRTKVSFGSGSGFGSGFESGCDSWIWIRIRILAPDVDQKLAIFFKTKIITEPHLQGLPPL